MKTKTIPFAMASVIALVGTSGAVMAETGSATAEVTAMPPALSIQEIQPYQMQIERAPGATMPTGSINLKQWSSNGILKDPAESVIPGCLQVAGDVDKAVSITMTGFSVLTAPGGAEITFMGGASEPKFEVATSTVDCSDAAAGSFTPTTLAGTPIASSTSATGELYLACRYQEPTNATAGYMSMSAWEEGAFTGTVDITVDYQ